MTPIQQLSHAISLHCIKVNGHTAVLLVQFQKGSLLLTFSLSWSTALIRRFVILPECDEIQQSSQEESVRCKYIRTDQRAGNYALCLAPTGSGYTVGVTYSATMITKHECRHTISLSRLGIAGNNSYSSKFHD